MGAGKTAFAQGFAAGLGVLDPVTSPTFTLVHAYEGRLRVYHADLYRLERMAELADLALGELLDDDDAVVLVEWGDVVSAALGADLMTVRLEWVGTDEPDLRLVVDHRRRRRLDRPVAERPVGAGGLGGGLTVLSMFVLSPSC